MCRPLLLVVLQVLEESPGKLKVDLVAFGHAYDIALVQHNTHLPGFISGRCHVV